MSGPQENAGQEAESGMIGGDVDGMSFGGPNDPSGTAEISDEHGNIYTVTLDELSAAGIDVNNMNDVTVTEEQMNTIMSMVEAPLDEQQMTADGEDGSAIVGETNSIEDANVQGDSTVEPMTLSILVDGGLKLTSSSGEDSYFSAAQLAELNMDATSLSDDDVTRIVRLVGMANGNEDEEEAFEEVELDEIKGIGEKRRRVDGRSRHYDCLTSGPLSTSVLPPAAVHRRPVNSNLIGETVQIKRGNGRMVPATVRYCRPGSGYKVQLGDGRFEWVGADRIVTRTPRLSDHQGYTSDPSTRRPAMVTGRPSCIRIDSVQQSIVDQQPSNFCCPVCDRKVFQKEPAYIVIRLPACDACTREKILIIDDPPPILNVQKPQMMSVACDTDDLKRTMEEGVDRDGKRVASLDGGTVEEEIILH